MALNFQATNEIANQIVILKEIIFHLQYTCLCEAPQPGKRVTIDIVIDLPGPRAHIRRFAGMLFPITFEFHSFASCLKISSL